MRPAALANPAIRTVWLEALFASPIQPSDTATDTQIAVAVATVLRKLGARGVVAVVATEYGDHPDRAVARMAWCHRCLTALVSHSTTSNTADRADSPVSPHVERCPR